MHDDMGNFDPATIPGRRGSLLVEDFADLFGTSIEDIPRDLQAEIGRRDFRYVVLEGEERDQTIVDVLKTIDSGQLSLAGPEGKGRWNKGWGENLDAFIASGFDLKALVPKYIRPRQPVRLKGGYALPVNPAFELDWYEVFRPWFLQTYLGGFEHVFEFASGSGFNLAALAQIDPGRHYVGLDWAAPSAEIVNRMGTHFGWNMQGRIFDFFNPDQSLDVPANSAFVTIGGLEQTGTNWGAFFDFIRAKRPACVLHIEPISEWYDDTKLFDYTALRFHHARNYGVGYVDWVEDLASRGEAEIIKRKRSDFGSLFLEGYSQLIWRPLS